MRRLLLALIVTAVFAAGCRGNGGGSPFSVSLASSTLVVTQDGTSQVAVSVNRHGGFHGAVAVVLESGPAGVTTEFLAIGVGQTGGTLVMTASPDAQIGEAPAVFAAIAEGHDAKRLEATLTVRGLPGVLDPTFADGGIARIGFDDYSSDGVSNDELARVLALPDGGLLLAGRAVWFDGGGIAFAKVDATGSLDATFGIGGRVVLDSDALGITDVAVQPDGKIVFSGYGSSVFFLVLRLMPDGALDTSFGTGGVASVPVGVPTAIEVQADGGILAAGYEAPYPFHYVVARFLPAGTLDPQFGTGGTVVESRTDLCLPNTLLPLPDGSFFAAGQGTDARRFSLAKYTAGGTPDTAFASAGVMVGGLGVLPDGGTWLTSALDPGGKLLLGGATFLNDFVFGRFDAATGAPDLDADGLVWYDYNLDFNALLEIATAPSPDGYWIYAATSSGAGGGGFLGTARLRADGTLDGAVGNSRGFGAAGSGVVIEAFDGAVRTSSLVLQPIGVDGDYRVVTAGSLYSGGESDFLAVRHWP